MQQTNITDITDMTTRNSYISYNSYFDKIAIYQSIRATERKIPGRSGTAGDEGG